MEKDFHRFGELLREYTSRQGITFRDLSVALKVHRATVSRWVNGDAIPSLDKVIHIPKVLSLSDEEAKRLFIAAGYQYLGPEINAFSSGSTTIDRCISCGKSKDESGTLIQVGNGGLLICAACASDSIEAFSQQGVFVRITRSIEFTREYHQAGISILSYFGTVLREKYADLEAKVRIEQQGLKVTLVVESPTGEQETIEKALNEYGMVVKGAMSPDEFYNGDALKILELKQQLGIAKLQLEGQQDLLRIAASQYDSRIHTLEEQIVWLRSHVGTLLEANPKALTVHTEGGAYIHGDVATQGGDVIARDARARRPKKKQKPIQP